MTAEIIPLPTMVRRQQPSSLSDQDCFSIAAAMQVLPGGWQAQRDEEADGVVVMSLFTHEEDLNPAFRVRRDADGFRLQGGLSARTIGRYSNVYELMRAAQRTLGR